jgi:hypothetical protein
MVQTKFKDKKPILKENNINVINDHIQNKLKCKFCQKHNIWLLLCSQNVCFKLLLFLFTILNYCTFKQRWQSVLNINPNIICSLKPL